MSGDQSSVGSGLTGTILVTGGAGFIGSAVVRRLMATTRAKIVNLDKLTYAANLASLDEIATDPRYCLEQVDICDEAALRRVLTDHRPTQILHLAAETHVDRSIDGPAAFIQANVIGTCTLLKVALDYWQHLDPAGKSAFRFHHVSTDEVFGALGDTGAFTEDTAYRPNSPYSASKAASDHFVRAWHHTYGLPVVTSNCSNNYGPWQFPEKLIPLVTLNALEGAPLPVYGQGANIRDWLFVDDHAAALLLILERGRLGETYNVGGHGERRNLAVVEAICDAVDELAPRSSGGSRRSLIRFVEDRPGHDFRYAIDDSKISSELGWRPEQSFEGGLKQTVSWYLNHEEWWRPLRERVYSGARLGRLANN